MKVAQRLKVPEPGWVTNMSLMGQAAQPWSESRIGDKGEHVVTADNAGGDAVRAAEEEMVKHPVDVEDHIVMRGVSPHIVPCAMRYRGFKHDRHIVLADEVRARHEDACGLVSHPRNREYGMWEARRHDAKPSKHLVMP